MGTIEDRMDGDLRLRGLSAVTRTEYRRRIGHFVGFYDVPPDPTRRRRDMLYHPHLHGIVTGGGLSADASRWISVPHEDFLFPVPAVSELFRGKFLSGFIDLWKAGKIDLIERQSRQLVREAKKHPRLRLPDVRSQPIYPYGPTTASIAP